jgi:AcrR family transcriptional regulator
MKKDKKVEILRIACRSFSEHGYEKSSIERIAGRAGVAVGLVRYYFRTKENLYFEAAHGVVSGLRDHLRELDFASFPPGEVVRLFVLEYMRYTSDPENAYWMIYQESPFAILNDPEHATKMVVVSMEIVALLQDVLILFWPLEQAKSKALLLIASLHGVQRARFSTTLREFVSLDDVGDFFARLVCPSACSQGAADGGFVPELKTGGVDD